MIGIMKILLSSIVITSLLAPLCWASSPIEATGLFKDRAMLRVLGQDRYVRVGETTPEGAKLLEADAAHALVSFNGETYRLSLTDRVAGRFAAVEDTSISIPPDSLGQYRVGGSINGGYVDFLVDTGASVVAISARQARALGIDFVNAENRSTVVTAQGEVPSYLVSLAEVNVGGITAHNVQAAVIEGNYPVDVLLGMSYLRNVQMRETAGVLLLERKY
jgi:aspartyl protease family protein